MNGVEPDAPWKPGAYRVRSARLSFKPEISVANALVELRRRAFANQRETIGAR
jgi:hypothetical protein